MKNDVPGKVIERKRDARYVLRKVIERERNAQKVKAKTRKLSKQGTNFKEGSTGDTVKPCPECNRWYVDSRQGKLAHAQRSPRCADTMESLIRQSSQI